MFRYTPCADARCAHRERSSRTQALHARQRRRFADQLRHALPVRVSVPRDSIPEWRWSVVAAVRGVPASRMVCGDWRWLFGGVGAPDPDTIRFVPERFYPYNICCASGRNLKQALRNLHMARARHPSSDRI